MRRRPPQILTLLTTAITLVGTGVADPIVRIDTVPTGLEGNAYIQDTARDADGNLYAVARADAPGLVPAARAGLSATLSGPGDAWVGKFDPGGSLLWATYLGGSGDDGPSGVTVDGSGRVVIVGWTGSADFPVVNGPSVATPGNGEAFVACLAADGRSIAWSGTVGALGNDQAKSVAIGPGNTVFVAGRSNGPDFPVTTEISPQRGSGGAVWISKFSAEGQLKWAIDLTGTGATVEQYAGRIAVDASGAAVVCGTTSGAGSLPPATVTNEYHGGSADGFVVRLNPSGMSLDAALYIGGAAPDGAASVALDDAGAMYVVGATQSGTTSFPRRVGPDTGTSDADPGRAFLVKLSPSGQSVEFSAAVPSRFWGGYDGLSRNYCVAVDAQRRSYVTFGSFLRYGADASTVESFAGTELWGPPLVVTPREIWVHRGHDLARVTDTSSGMASAPSQVEARATSARSVKVTWTGSGDETAFEIERAGATGTFGKVATVGGASASWEDVGLVPETNYRYRVRAVLAAESSSPSAYVTVRTPGSFSLRVQGARLVNSTRARRDSVQLRATAMLAGRAGFVPSRDALRMTIGDGAPAAYTLDVNAGDAGWRRSGQRLRWRSPRGLRARTTVVLDVRRDLFVLRGVRLDVAGLPADPAEVELRLGEDAATDEPVWQRRADAMFVR